MRIFIYIHQWLQCLINKENCLELIWSLLLFPPSKLFKDLILTIVGVSGSQIRELSLELGQDNAYKLKSLDIRAKEIEP